IELFVRFFCKRKKKIFLSRLKLLFSLSFFFYKTRWRFSWLCNCVGFSVVSFIHNKKMERPFSVFWNVCFDRFHHHLSFYKIQFWVLVQSWLAAAYCTF